MYFIIIIRAAEYLMLQKKVLSRRMDQQRVTTHGRDIFSLEN